MTRRFCQRLGLMFVLAGTAWGAEIRRVPQDYPSTLAAYQAAVAGDIIEVSTNLLLEIPPVLFDAGKAVQFRPAGGRAIITANLPPTNDTFAGRAILAGANPTITTFNYSAAVAPESGDPLPRAVNGNSAAFGRSLWFEWTAPDAGLVIINSYGSDFDTLLDVFTGTPPSLAFVNSSWFGFNEVGFNALAGVTYSILVGGQNRAFGEIRVNVTYAAPPPNDAFASAYTLTGNVAQISGATFGATRELPGEPNHALALSSHSVWFRWTAPTNEAQFSRPVSFSTAGSDFDTVLAVYEGTNLAALTLRTNNNDRAPNLRESLITFTPVPGRTYQIALDGSALSGNARGQVGNYLLRVDYSLVNAEVRNVVPNPPVNQEVGFRADLLLRDWGFASTAPLQVRLVARSGRDFAGVHRNAASNELTLATYSVPARLLPNGVFTLPVAAICPAPVVTNAVTNIWGVFAVVEESFAGLWVPVDRVFMLYGVVPETGGPILSYGAGRPTPPDIVKNELNQIESTDVWLSNYVTDKSSNTFSILARLETGTDRILTNTAVWRGPAGMDLTTNGVLRLGEVLASTSFMVTGIYKLGGQFQNRVSSVPIYRRPSLAFQHPGGRNIMSYTIQSDFAAAYSLELSPSLDAPPIATNYIGWLPTFPASGSITNLSPGFYRLHVSSPR